MMAAPSRAPARRRRGNAANPSPHRDTRAAILQCSGLGVRLDGQLAWHAAPPQHAYRCPVGTWRTWCWATSTSSDAFPAVAFAAALAATFLMPKRAAHPEGVALAGPWGIGVLPGPDQVAAQLGDQGRGSPRSLGEQNAPRQNSAARHAQGQSGHAVSVGRPGQMRHHGNGEAVPDQARGGRVVDRLESYVGLNAQPPRTPWPRSSQPRSATFRPSK